MNAELAAAFDTQLQQAREHVAASRLEAAYGCLERAHVLGQWHTLPHLRTHWGLLQVGVRRRDVREIVGQMLRLVAALIATPVGLVPAGNTGGARVSPWRTMPIEPDAERLLRSDPRSARGLEKR
jgi:hypothetical protein